MLSARLMSSNCLFRGLCENGVADPNPDARASEIPRSTVKDKGGGQFRSSLTPNPPKQ